MASLVILALTQPWGTVGRAQNPNRDIPTELQELADARSAAVKARDREAFLATVDPAAADFVAAQGSWFDRQSALGIEGYSLKVDLDEAPEFTRARDRDRYGRQVVIAGVEERFRITGFDEHPALGALFYTFVRREDRWLIANDTDLEDLGLFTARQPWDFGPVSVLTSEHFIVVCHPEDVEPAGRMLDIAEAALPGVARVWTQPWAGRAVIVIPATPSELSRLLDATFDVSNFVAVAASSVDLDEGWNPVTRVIINPDTFLRRTRATQIRIMTHELVHVATRQASGPFVTSFVEEGIAQLAESEQLPRLSQAAPGLRSGFDGTLPEDFEFFSGGGAAIRRSYLKALTAAIYINERYGIAKFNDFYAALGSARIEPGVASFHLDRAMQSALGLSLAEFVRAWGGAVRSG